MNLVCFVSSELFLLISFSSLRAGVLVLLLIYYEIMAEFFVFILIGFSQVQMQSFFCGLNVMHDASYILPLLIILC